MNEGVALFVLVLNTNNFLLLFLDFMWRSFIFTSLHWFCLLGCNHETFASSKHCSLYGCSYSTPKLVHSYRIFIKVSRFPDMICLDILLLLFSMLILVHSGKSVFIFHWTEYSLWISEVACIIFCKCLLLE
jgi:predicted glycosyltransferase involved in capsule biosynthesis